MATDLNRLSSHGTRYASRESSKPGSRNQPFKQWPSYRTFVLDGRMRLHAALMRTGGPQRWALELGVSLVERPPGPGLSHAEITAALRNVLREHRPAQFPNGAWLARHYGNEGRIRCRPSTAKAPRPRRSRSCPPRS